MCVRGYLRIPNIFYDDNASHTLILRERERERGIDETERGRHSHVREIRERDREMCVRERERVCETISKKKTIFDVFRSVFLYRKA